MNEFEANMDRDQDPVAAVGRTERSLLDEVPIRLGDTVTIGDVNGTVTKIRIRATTITDWDRKELIVPNTA